MKIESVRIENFGKLNDFSLSLKDGLNSFKEDNGWGKTTLTVFIRVMFYGFEGEGKHSALSNERTKYTPWQGGIFGGFLVFETKGKRYRITRQFGTKKSEDIFELRDEDTGLISTDFTEEIGKELFHINSESFMHTVFISQNDCSSSDTTDDINSRIGNISDSTDMNRYQNADDTLNKALNKLADKKTGEQGRLKESISELRIKVNAGRETERALDEINARLHDVEIQIENIKNEQSELVKQRTKASGVSRLLNEKDEYERLDRELTEKREACEREKSWFPCDVPTKERIEIWEKCQDSMNTHESVAESVQMTEEEKEELLELGKTFETRTPDPIINSTMLDKADELNRLRSVTPGVSLSQAETEKLSLFRMMFEKSQDPVRDVNRYSEKYNKSVQMAERVTYMQDELKIIEKKYKRSKAKSKFKLILTLIIGVLLIAAGLCTLFIPAIKDVLISKFTEELVILMQVLIITSGIGVFCIVGISRLFNNNLKNDAESIKERQELVEKTDKDAKALSYEVNNYLLSNKFMHEGGDVQEALQKLLNNALEFRSLNERYIKFKENDHTEECEMISRRIKEYLIGYEIDVPEHEFSSSIARLGTMASRFNYLTDKKQKADTYKSKSEMSTDEFRNQLELFGFEANDDLNALFAEIREHLDSYSHASALLADAIVRMNRFESNHDMEKIREELAAEDCVSSEEIDEKIRLLEERRDELERARKIDVDNLDTMQERYEEYIDNLRLLDEKTALLEEAGAKYNKVSRAKDFLQKARENMTSRYVVPLKNGFDKYFGKMTSESGNDYNLDANLCLTKNEAGMMREKERLSHGYKDLLGFCMRLSMADTMYKGEKPVLILDDPFVNLDTEKMKAATSLLVNTAEEYQIIYMTCREDRLPKI